MSDFLTISGAVAITAGAFVAHPAAGLIALGAFLLASGVLLHQQQQKGASDDS